MDELNENPQVQMLHYVTDAETLCCRQISLIGVMKSATHDENVDVSQIRMCLEILDSLIPDPDKYANLMSKLNAKKE